MKNPFQKIKQLQVLIICLSLITFSGCIPVLIGATAVSSVVIAHDRRTTGSIIDDQLIETKVKTRFLTNDQLKGSHINVTSMNGVVLLTGQTPQPEMRTVAIDLTKKTPEVRQVINEIQISGKSSLPSRTNDSWITTKVKTSLFDASNLDPSRIKVVTEYGVVYLMGLVTQIEGDSASDKTRIVGGVQRVVKAFEYID